MSLFDELRRVLDEGGRAVVLTIVSGENLGAKLLVREDGSTVGDGPAELAALAPAAPCAAAAATCSSTTGLTVFADVFAPPPRLFVYGAVDTAEALCRAAKLVGWTTVVADARARFATRERLPSADEILVAWPEEAFAQVQPDVGTAVVVLTHDDKFDLPALKAALASEAFYVGALGSRRNQERRRERLLEAGVARGGARPDRRPVRPRHRRRVLRGDRPVDARRDARDPRGPLRRAAAGLEVAHPRGTARRQKIKSHLQHLSCGA